jgi:prepilin-type processing-associated H-X9-DG protein
MKGGNEPGRGKALSPLVFVTALEIRHSALRFTFMNKDTGNAYDSGGTGMFPFYAAGWGDWDTLPGNRDNRSGSNLGFADGHIDPHSWRQWLKHRGPCANPQDAEELHWLQERRVEPAV